MAEAIEVVEAPVPVLDEPVEPGALRLLINRIWYQSTDLLSFVSPWAAERLDWLKERLEWELSSRRSAARRARLEQEQESATAIQQQRQQEQNL